MNVHWLEKYIHRCFFSFSSEMGKFLKSSYLHRVYSSVGIELAFFFWIFLMVELKEKMVTNSCSCHNTTFPDINKYQN